MKVEKRNVVAKKNESKESTKKPEAKKNKSNENKSNAYKSKENKSKENKSKESKPKEDQLKESKTRVDKPKENKANEVRVSGKRTERTKGASKDASKGASKGGSKDVSKDSKYKKEKNGKIDIDKVTIKGDEDSALDSIVLEIEIVDIGDEGEGIGKSEGMTVFVDGGLPGDIVSCQIVEQKKSFAKAKLKKVIKPSPFRVEAPCSVYQSCGGCQIQDLAYESQLKYKEKMVLNALKRVGQFADVEVNPIIGMKDSFRYRNKGFYPVQGNITQPLIGFYKKNSHSVVDVRDCLLQDERNAVIIEVIRKYMRDFKVAPYDSRSHEGAIKSVMIRKSEVSGEMMVVLVTSGRKLAMTKTLVNLLTTAVPTIVSVIQNVHASHSIKGLGEESKLLYGKTTITDHIGDLKFEISAESFYQVNAKQTEVLYKKALEYAELSGEETVYELYSGTGTISLFLAQKAKKVYGIEIVPAAVENARENAKLNHIENVEFILGSAEDAFVTLYEEGHRADVVVVDPPRSGCEPEVIETILKMAPSRIVYVSCKPATLARDLRLLCEGGAYTISEVQPMDVFGHTSHVECVIGLRRNESL